MKTSLAKRCVFGAVALGSAAGLLATAAPAQAVVPPPGVVIAAAGSDTTDDLMTAILTGTNQYNIRATPASAQFVEGDANCTDLTYNKAPVPVGQVLSPNGSSNGRNALAQAASNPAGPGCIDIARSSAGPRPISSNEPATFEYYALAMDSLGWASPSLAAPATMTKQQLKDIYACNITDWSQLPGGGSGPIQRYIPQTGSGTYGFFLSDLLDGVAPVASGPNCPAGIFIQENTGMQIAPADFQKAIVPYSVGQWMFQANNSINPTIDLRNEAKLGGFTTPLGTNANAARWNGLDGGWEPNTGTTPATPVNENNIKLNNPTPDYPGIRYVFNVVNSVSVNYAEARAVVGFNNVGGGTKSPLCSNGKISQILSFGFAPLPTSVNINGNNLAGATCRKYVPV